LLAALKSSSGRADERSRIERAIAESERKQKNLARALATTDGDQGDLLAERKAERARMDALRTELAVFQAPPTALDMRRKLEAIEAKLADLARNPDARAVLSAALGRRRSAAFPVEVEGRRMWQLTGSISGGYLGALVGDLGGPGTPSSGSPAEKVGEGECHGRDRDPDHIGTDARRAHAGQPAGAGDGRRRSDTGGAGRFHDEWDHAGDDRAADPQLRRGRDRVPKSYPPSTPALTEVHGSVGSRARATSGGSAGSPRCSRMRRTGSRSVMTATTRSRPRHFGQLRHHASHAVAGGAYSIPSRWCGHTVDLFVGTDSVSFAYGDEVVCHPRVPFGGRSVDYRHLLLPLSRKPQALRQVVREIVAQFGSPWPELWDALRACYPSDEIEAARRLAPWLEQADRRGLARVARRMRAALADGTLVPPPLRERSSGALAEIPASLRAYAVESPDLRRYDSLLEAARCSA
jgi:hypothetical protein